MWKTQLTELNGDPISVSFTETRSP